MNKLTVLRHVDVIAGVLVFLLVGRFGPPELGILAIAAGVAAYFLVNRFYSPARQ